MAIDQVSSLNVSLFPFATEENNMSDREETVYKISTALFGIEERRYENQNTSNLLAKIQHSNFAKEQNRSKGGN
ncbi:MAG: hypothetical protein K940chlam8_00095 [Chlamydiae bacterium]|nr:hypothetical protein [Chlamydiota bacterium]